MQLITAWLNPEKLNDVVYALHEVPGLRGLSVSEGRGFGLERLRESDEMVQREPGNFTCHVRLELLCADADAATITRTICEQGHTGRRGDGLVVCTPAGTCRSIRTGQVVDHDRE